MIPLQRWCVLGFLLAAVAAAPQAAPSYVLTFSTYIGGSQADQIRDLATDAQGNVYAVGGTPSPNFPTTAGAFQRTHNPGTPESTSVNTLDVFVMKFNPAGQLQWSTFVGGPNYDRAYAVEVDSQGYVYVAGRAGNGFPVTAGALQTQFMGGQEAAFYGNQDGFIFKMRPDGSGLVWSTYFGSSDAMIIRDIDIDSAGNVYLGSGYKSGTYPSSVGAAFRNSPAGGISDTVVAKVNSAGSQVVWARYVGGSGGDGGNPSVRVVPATGQVVVCTTTQSTNLPVTTGAFDSSYNGSVDSYVAKLAADGSSLAFCTYLGGSGDDSVAGTHNLALDALGNVYVTGRTTSTNFPATPGALQTTNRGGFSGVWEQDGDFFVSKLSSNGQQLVASTYLGGTSGENGEGIAVDASGNVFFAGQSQSTNFPVTADAYQSIRRGAGDGVVVKLASGLNQLLYATYMGGSTTGATGECFRALAIDSTGAVYAGGVSSSTDWPVLNAYQGTASGQWDAVLARFAPPPASYPGALQFAAAGASVSEAGGSLTLSVSRTGGSSGQVSVSYATSNGTASSGSDYSARTGTLTWISGDGAPKSITVPILDDPLPEGNETFTVTLSNPTNGATLGSPTTSTVTIVDNDNPISTPTGVAAMAGDGRVTLVWNRVTGATSYTVYMGTSPGVTRTAYGMSHPNAASPFVHTGLSNGTTYYFVVTAVNAGGESGESVEVSATPAASGWPIPDTDGDGYGDAAETAAGSNPNDPLSTPVDTDGDGMADAWETAQLGGLTAQPGDDPDGDGASNLLEFNAGTNPNVADTDGDGFSDGVELAGGTNPLDPASFPGGGGPPPGGGGSSGGGNCGATGLEGLILFAILLLRRKP